MNIADAVHCSGCGRQLGLEPLAERDELSCPHCQQPFEAFSGGPGLLHDCRHCGGQFVEHGLLRDLLERREVYGHLVPRHAEAGNPLDQPVRYVPCPVCGALMNRRNFGQRSGVIVDVCQQHGTWFDCGELPRVLAFVENGGLARARFADQQRGNPTVSRVPMPAATEGRPLELWDDLTEAAGALLSFLGDLLRRA